MMNYETNDTSLAVSYVAIFVCPYLRLSWQTEDGHLSIPKHMLVPPKANNKYTDLNVVLSEITLATEKATLTEISQVDKNTKSVSVG